MMVESWKELKTSYMVSSFIVCSNRNRSALVHDLLSYNSQFVAQLYEDKSLAGDLIFCTTDLQTVNYYTKNHCQSLNMHLISASGLLNYNKLQQNEQTNYATDLCKPIYSHLL